MHRQLDRLYCVYKAIPETLDLSRFLLGKPYCHWYCFSNVTFDFRLKAVVTQRIRHRKVKVEHVVPVW